MSKIGINNFARTRHTKFSPYSYYAGTEQELLALVEANLDKGRQGYKEGVLLVEVPPASFYTGVVIAKPGVPLRAEFKARREGEEPYVQVFAANSADSEQPTKMVEIVCYHKDILGGEATANTEYEIVSINARDTTEEEPPTPMAMARNMLNLPGGTPAQYTAEQFAKSIAYWSNRVMCG